MKKSRIAGPVVIMILAALAGFFIGSYLNDSFGGAILFSMIAGIACIIGAMDDRQD